MDNHGALIPVRRLIIWIIGVMMILTLGAVPACSGGTEDKQEITEVDETEIVQNEDTADEVKSPVRLPPIDELASEQYETATFASG